MTFTLASKEEGGGQRFRCAKIVKQTNKEVLLETFTQSQCYRKALNLLPIVLKLFLGKINNSFGDHLLDWMTIWYVFCEKFCLKLI